MADVVGVGPENVDDEPEAENAQPMVRLRPVPSAPRRHMRNSRFNPIAVLTRIDTGRHGEYNPQQVLENLGPLSDDEVHSRQYVAENEDTVGGVNTHETARDLPWSSPGRPITTPDAGCFAQVVVQVLDTPFRNEGDVSNTKSIDSMGEFCGADAEISAPLPGQYHYQTQHGLSLLGRNLVIQIRNSRRI